MPLVKQQQVSVETPANADVVTLQVGSTLRRTDKQKDNGLLLALVDTVTMDRRTALAVSTDTNPGGSVQRPRSIDDQNPATPAPLPHEGLTYRFPFDTEKKSYPLFDPIAQKPYDANYEGEEDVNGLTHLPVHPERRLRRRRQARRPAQVLLAVRQRGRRRRHRAGRAVGPARRPEEPITMTRYYAAQRTFWVDPVSGTIVKEQEHGYHYYAREALKPEVTFVDYKVTSNEDTVESQVASARDERDKVALWSRILPITFTGARPRRAGRRRAARLVQLRAESALIDPGLDSADHGFFGRRDTDSGPMPAAEAQTEKLPTQRPRTDRRTDRSDHPLRSAGLSRWR